MNDELDAVEGLPLESFEPADEPVSEPAAEPDCLDELAEAGAIPPKGYAAGTTCWRGGRRGIPGWERRVIDAYLEQSGGKGARPIKWNAWGLEWDSFPAPAEWMAALKIMKTLL